MISIQAYKRGMWYPEYLFMLNGWYRDRWWMVEDHQFLDCSPEQIEQVLNMCKVMISSNEHIVSGFAAYSGS